MTRKVRKRRQSLEQCIARFNMKIVNDANELHAMAKAWKAQGKTIGFTPTMGALHKGHISLVAPSLKENDISIVSIFVNPTQFNESSDLEKYPRTLDEDAALCEAAGVDIIFAPGVNDVYPEGADYSVDLPLGNMATVLEGEHRPGHFEGVIQVVKRLLEICIPDHLYMGQKDFQQFSIIQRMIDYFEMPVTLRVCPIKRAYNGLALSSRNQRLSKEGKLLGSIIYSTLCYVKENFEEKSIAEWREWAMLELTNDWSTPEYFEFSDGQTLETVHDTSKHDYIVASTAVWIDEVRLIDNMTIKQEFSN